MTPFRLCVALALLGSGCATFSQTSATSNTSGGSSGQSANSSKQSADSSAASGASSQQSSGSSNQSRNSSATAQSSANSSNATTDAPSSSVVAGSALLLAAAGGIITTVYTVKHRREARLQREQLKQLQQAPAPQPMPYQVEPIPLQPGVTSPQPTPGPSASALPEDEPSLDALVMARAWLLANALQLKQDLALGAGPTLEDLAGIAGIPPAHRSRFGRLLQEHRAELLSGHDVTEQEAARVMARVGDLVMADPLLRADGGAALAATF
ncbi:MAG: DUF3015 family protein [Archangium sp.]|nr:DUF3015 family protein [Archangium sp.]